MKLLDLSKARGKSDDFVVETVALYHFLFVYPAPTIVQNISHNIRSQIYLELINKGFYNAPF